MTDAIIKVAARVIYNNGYDEEYSERHYMTARAVLRAVTPLIEAAALERAAKVVEDYDSAFGTQGVIAAAIRALIVDPPVMEIPPGTS